MDFWSTVLGHHLAEVLIRTLPKLAGEEKKQYCRTCGATNQAILYVFEEEQKKGSRLVTSILSSNNQVVLVFESDAD